jgi:hypothetical protein
MGTTIKNLRRISSAAASNGLDATIKSLCGAAGIDLGTTAKCIWPRHNGQIPVTRSERRRATCNGLGTMIKCLRRTTSGAAGNGLGRYRGLLIFLFAKSAPHSPFLCARFLRQQAE